MVAHVGARRWGVLLLLVVTLLAAGCAVPAAPWESQSTQLTPRPAPAATPVSPLANHTIYWSQNVWLAALRASDGQPRWRIGNWSQKLPGCDSCTYSDGPNSPVLANGALYSLTINDHASAAVYALSASDGATLWQTPVAGCLGFPANTPPLVADGVVYVALTGLKNSNFACGPSGWVYALRASDGHVLWRAPFQRAVEATLALNDGVLLVSNSSYPANPVTVWLTGLRASDGKQLWRRSGTNLFISFTAGDGLVITVGGAGATYASGLSVKAFRARDGAPVWESVLASSHPNNIATILLANGAAYVHDGSGYLSALRLSDGQVRWHMQTGMRFAAAPTFANGRLYMGIGPALDVLDPASGALLHSYAVPGLLKVDDPSAYTWSAPVITGAAIFVSVGVLDCQNAGPMCQPSLLDGKLYALDDATGRLLWQYQTPDGYEVSAPVLG